MTNDWLQVDGPTNSKATLILAHGAGAGLDHPFMQFMAEGLAAQGIKVLRFNFPYMQKRQQDGRKRPPDRQDKLLDCFTEAVATQQQPLFIGGKSMGARMATLLAAAKPELQLQGIICLGYPFHAPGKKEQWRAEHFVDITCPTLIIQGSRDTFGNAEELAAHPLPASFRLQLLTDGDHSFKPRKASGFSEAEHWQQAVDWMAAFIDAQLD